MIDGDATLGQTHYPQLRVFANLVDTTATTAPATDESDANGNAFKVFDVKGHQVTLTSNGSSTVTRKTGLRPGNDKLPTPATKLDVTWMPEMQKLTPTGHAKVNAQCLAADPTSAKVAARVRIQGGELTSRFPSAGNDFSTITFNFTPQPATRYEQALGEGQLADQITGDRVVFSLEPFSGGSSKLIVLKADGANNLTVGLRNAANHQCSSLSEVRNLTHFAAYYELLDGADKPATAARAIPVASGTTLPTCKSEDEFIHCPNGTYDDVI